MIIMLSFYNSFNQRFCNYLNNIKYMIGLFLLIFLTNLIAIYFFNNLYNIFIYFLSFLFFLVCILMDTKLIHRD